MPFFGRGANHLVVGQRVRSVAKPILEGPFYATIFAGVKRQDGHAAYGFDAGWKTAEERRKRTKLVVDRDAQCLEDPTDRIVGMIHRAACKSRVSLVHHGGQ